MKTEENHRSNPKYKRIWITTDWEANSLTDEKAQCGRMNQLAHHLANSGYEVVLWFTTYVHPEKRYLCNKTKVVQVGERERIVLLHSCVSYKKNTSPKRFLYHSVLALEMKKMIKNHATRFPRPDIIFCSYPTEQFCNVALEYGEENGIPVIMDARDQWPDIFVRAFPKRIQKMSGVVLAPIKSKTAKDFSRATAICAMSPVMLNWALSYARREKTALDRYVYIGCKKTTLSETEMETQLGFWKNFGIGKDTWNICLFSTLSKSALDIDTVVKAVCKVHARYPQIRLVIGGKGDDEERLRGLTDIYPYIVMAGWLDRNQMSGLMAISKAGLLCYRNTPDFKDGWGNKVGQYLSYGLPLLTSSEGFAKSYVNHFGCGLAYRECDSDDLSRILFRLIEDENFRAGISKKAAERYEADFEESKTMNKFECMINDVCEFYYGECANEYTADKSLCWKKGTEF